MVEAVIRGLIGLCLIVLCVVVVLWVLAALGIHLPPMVIQILYVIAVLVCILWIVRLLRPHWGSWFP